MFGSFMVYLGLFCDICFCFYFVRFNKHRSQIALTVLAAVDERNNMVTLPLLSRPDLSSREITNTAVTIKNADTNTSRNGSVIIFPNPFFI